ncbi:MAG TPA: PilZ domain-containing protein [Thermoanaerobaculia bacterium]
MSRRRAVRRPRRVQVHFWKHGEPTAYIGYTTNISTTGMFIATNSPMPSGVRVRVEIVDRDRGFMVEGLVAHARKMRSDLARLNQSGMGVRFLSVEELVRELFPAGLGETEEIAQLSATRPMPAVQSPAPAPDPPPAPEPPPQEAVQPAPPPPAPEPEKPAGPLPPVGGTFSVRFSGTEEFMEVYRRDILQGGLFVSTRYPARLQEAVNVELYPPLPYAEPILVRARVVQRFEPTADSGPNLLAGMGLELLELAALIQRLEPVVQRLRGSYG